VCSKREVVASGHPPQTSRSNSLKGGSGSRGARHASPAPTPARVPWAGGAPQGRGRLPAGHGHCFLDGATAGAVTGSPTVPMARYGGHQVLKPIPRLRPSITGQSLVRHPTPLVRQRARVGETSRTECVPSVHPARGESAGGTFLRAPAPEDAAYGRGSPNSAYRHQRVHQVCDLKCQPGWREVSTCPEAPTNPWPVPACGS